MPRQRRFYDPFIQIPEPSHVTPEPEPIQGIRVSHPGIYLRIEDIVATIRSLAANRSKYNEDEANVVNAVADSFEQFRLV